MSDNQFSMQRMSFLASNPLRLPTIFAPSLESSELKEQDDNQKVSYRSTLLQALHPDSQFCLVDVSGCEEDQPAEVLAQVHSIAGQGYKFDFASGSRKHGVFVFSDSGDISTRYFNKDYRRISHGSILTTNCHKGMYRLENAKVVVLDEEKYPEYVESLGLGDCFGVMSHRISRHVTSQVQFRAGVRDSWIAKGCLLPTRAKLPMDVDLILPKSSFKGFCPEEEEVFQYSELFLGFHLEAERRNAAASHTGLVWFSSPEAVEHLKRLTSNEIDELNVARTDIQSCANMMSNSLNVKTIDIHSDHCDDLITVDEDSTLDPTDIPIIQVLKSSNSGHLLHHPKVVAFLNKMWAKKYTQTSLSAGITGDYLMAAPMQELPHGFIISSDLPTGKHIMQRYPIRGRMDIKQVVNLNPADFLAVSNMQDIPKEWADIYFNATGTVNQNLSENGVKRFSNYSGNFFINPTFFAEVGGDFDGDCTLFLDGNLYSPLYNEIATWELPPEPVKKKVAMVGDVYEIAQKSMGNETGLVTWLNIMRWILGITVIWYNGEYINLDQEMAHQLQLAVDSFKSDTTIDAKLLNELNNVIKNELAQHGSDIVTWLNDYKNSNGANNLFEFRNSYVDTYFNDPVSQMIKIAQSKWLECQWKPLASPHFQPLFDFNTVTDDQQAWGNRWYDKYVKTVADLFGHLKDKYGNITCSDAKFNQALDSYKEILASYESSFSHLDEEQRLGVATVIWRAAHRASSNPNVGREKYSMASICFQLFPTEIVEALANKQVKKICGFLSKDYCDMNPNVVEQLVSQQVKIEGTNRGLSIVSIKTGQCVLMVAPKSQGKSYFLPWLGSTWTISSVQSIKSRDGSRVVGYELSV